MLPSALVLGAQKGGTTSLYHYLLEHPSVLPPTRKEIGFFCKRYRFGSNWYRSHFPLALQRLAVPGAITLEASTGYLDHIRAPARVREMLPEARLIVILRNPIDRAWSHYHHTVRLGHEPLSFEEALACEAQRLDGYFQRDEVDDRSLSHHAYRSRGHYAEQLLRWLEHFPREQLLVLANGDLERRPAVVMAEVLSFIGLSPRTFGEFQRHNSGDNYRHGKRRKEMDPTTRERLAAYYEPHNQKLYELLGRDFGWK